MSVELDLKSDYSFYLKQTYLTLNGKTFESSGKWYPTPDLSSFVLNKNKNLSFYFKDKNTIEKLDDNGEKANSNKYTLKK
ncbi:MAG: copper resistance protein NlpE [Endomicrobium sp.]|nr:copper resistance protein NlpE [Endomicrobium sp.]